MALSGKDGGASILRAGRVATGLVDAAFEHELWDVDTVGDLARIERALRL